MANTVATFCCSSQVERNRDWLRDYLGVSGPPDLIMEPVIVVPGWFVESKGNYTVKAMNAEYLVHNYLTKLERAYSPGATGDGH